MPAERLFSKLDAVVCAKRSRLKAELISMILMLKSTIEQISVIFNHIWQINEF